jgi:hypothetical protein
VTIKCLDKDKCCPWVDNQLSTRVGHNQPDAPTIDQNFDLFLGQSNRLRHIDSAIPTMEHDGAIPIWKHDCFVKGEHVHIFFSGKGCVMTADENVQLTVDATEDLNRHTAIGARRRLGKTHVLQFFVPLNNNIIFFNFLLKIYLKQTNCDSNK